MLRVQTVQEPKDQKVQMFVGVWITPDLKEKLRARARRQHRSMSAVLRRLLEAEM
jgi:guanylate kinase